MVYAPKLDNSVNMGMAQPVCGAPTPPAELGGALKDKLTSYREAQKAAAAEVQKTADRMTQEAQKKDPTHPGFEVQGRAQYRCINSPMVYSIVDRRTGETVTPGGWK